jgi:PAS domain S-box-containing protein
MARFGLRARLVLGIALIGLIMASLIVGWVFSRLAKVEKHAVEVALPVAAAVATGIFVLGEGEETKKIDFHHADKIQEWVENLHEIQKRDVAVTDRDKRIVADVIRTNIGQIFAHDDGEVAATIIDGRPRTFNERSRDYPHGIERLVVPLTSNKGQTAGALIFDYTSICQKLTEEASREAVGYATIGILTLLMVTGIGFLLIRVITSPVLRLGEAVRRLGTGDLDAEIPPAGSNEIGDLARAFEEMRRSLRYSIRERDDEIERRTRMEESLRESAECQRAMIQTSPLPILILDPSGIVKVWSSAAERTFGWREEEVLGQPIPIVPPQRREEFRERFASILGGDHLEGIETQRLKKDGTLLEVAIFAGPLRDGRGKVVGATIILADITERKRIEDELRRAKAAAESADRAKSAFLATMSHEIRTPLNGVIGMVGLLLETGLSAEQRRFAEMARFSGESLLIVINDILDFSKIEAGKMELEVTDFDLLQAVENTGALFAARAHEKGLDLNVSVLTPLAPVLRGDPFRLGQVLSNLVNNAVKFTERGEVTVRIDQTEGPEGQVLLRGEVRDTGIGLSEAEQAGLFRPFVQADASTTRRYGGTGLGLTICRRLVEIMGGRIWVESEPGWGTAFRFEVPMEKGTAAPPLPPDAHLAGHGVLIVDDNATNREILTHQTISWGMRPVSAAGGAEALRILRAGAGEKAPGEGWGEGSVAILDMAMPGMDGLELAQLIRADPALTGITLVLLTSVDRGDLCAAAREAGIAACLTKPVRQSELYDSLARILATDAAATATNPAVVPAATPGRRAAAGTRILVAEDNTVNQVVATMMLRARGYQADIARNGREALAALESVRYAAVLMDCQMPEMDGFEATAEIRRREGDARRTPIIALTANALRGEREKCLAAGMDDYLSKPLLPEVLFTVLERWIPAEPVPPLPFPSPGGGEGEHDEEQALDPARLEKLRRMQTPGEKDIVAALADLFLKDTDEKLRELREAIAQGQPDELAQAAHGLKGNSANLGAARLSGLCAELETMGRSGNPTAASSLLTRIEAEFIRVRVALLKQTGGGTDAPHG